MAKEHSRLCCLIDHYLRPYTVYTESKRRVKEFESDDSFQDMAGNSVGGGQIITESHAANHHCLTNVFEVLILMIRLSNQIHLDYSIVILWLDLIHTRRKALLELHEWLREHLPGDRFDHDMYSEKCMDFVSSFLQLYMQEDDILFEMLLQMFCLPFYSEKFTNEVALSDDELRQFSLISHLFHPIHFFHLFLAVIH
ncbi:hypothetical protein K7X08_019430 [Anisodus acutangulus]|uniref:Uncharacterized protein n=1 Tax=Anisodus acutangulus TaxID=402998 RepID=A0A9Q1RPH3_9SOLA|nr:hypothetical protein K7X08_019430 [Anisodus acutangulus]